MQSLADYKYSLDGFPMGQITVSRLNLDLTSLIFTDGLQNGNRNSWSAISSLLAQVSIRCLSPSVKLPPTSTLGNILGLLTTALSCVVQAGL